MPASGRREDAASSVINVAAVSAVSTDLRIPLMWKDTEYFKNKGGEAAPPLPAVQWLINHLCL